MVQKFGTRFKLSWYNVIVHWLLERLVASTALILEGTLLIMGNLYSTEPWVSVRLTPSVPTKASVVLNLILAPQPHTATYTI